MTDEQSDQSKAEKQLARFSRAYLIKKSSGKSYDYYDGAQMRQMHKWASEEKAAELQLVIDRLQEERAYFDNALRKIRDIARRKNHSPGSTVGEMAEIAIGATGGMIFTEPVPEPKPDSLKDLREAEEMSVDYVNGYLRKCGLTRGLDKYEDGTCDFEYGSPVCDALSELYELLPKVVIAGLKQSVREYNARKETS